MIPAQAVEAAAEDQRFAMGEVVEQAVRSVFMDSPETDSETMATNVTRALWDAGYRQVRRRHNHMTRDFREGCEGCQK